MGNEPGPVATTGNDLVWMSATELSSLIRARRLSPVELVDALLERIDALNPRLRAYLCVDHDGAREAARGAEAAVMRGDALGLLHGLPVSIKDARDVKGMPTTKGSPVTSGNPLPVEDGYLPGLTRRAGAILLGKTNLPAFGHYDVTQNLLGPPCVNPWDLRMNSGGSSGGAACAAAAGLGPLHHGSDAGGSVRIPADRCGVLGFKPSVGRIGFPGTSSFGCGISHEGTLTRTVADAALLMGAWSRPCKYDYFSIDAAPQDYSGALAGWEKALAGKKVGFTLDYGWIKAVDPEVRRLVTAASLRFSELGCKVEEVKPGWSNPLRAFLALWCPSWSPVKALFQGRPELMDETFKEQLEIGSRVTTEQFVRALIVKQEIFQSVQKFFDGYDLLLSPVCAVPAFPQGEEPTEIDGTPTSYLDMDMHRLIARIPFTPVFNMTGNPAASVPCGFTDQGLPVGLHVAGGWHQDALVLQACAGFEAIQPWSGRRPGGI
ncbi:MAG: amidase family protein [Isosphaeraceae bacterium]